jgi:hypothetical protein
VCEQGKGQSSGVELGYEKVSIVKIRICCRAENLIWWDVCALAGKTSPVSLPKNYFKFCLPLPIQGVFKSPSTVR